MNNKEND